MTVLFVAPGPPSNSERASRRAGAHSGIAGPVCTPAATHQVTYDGEPLYLFNQDAYISGITGTQSINGAGAGTPWGVFNTIPPLL